MKELIIMRLLVRIFAPLALIPACLAPAGATAAPAAEGANVIKEFGCTEGGNPGAPALFTTQTQAVITPSGSTKLTCRFEGPPVEENVSLRDVPCFTFLGFATTSTFVYTKSGQAILTCIVTPQPQ